MIQCRELTRMVANGQLADASWWRRVTARLHMLMCRYCRGYARQIDTIGAEARESAAVVSSDDASALERLERNLGPENESEPPGS